MGCLGVSVRTLDGHRPYPINLESAGLCEASVCLIVIEGGACWPPVVKERLGCPLAIVDLSAYWTSYTYERLKLSKCMPELKGGACWASGVNERPGRPLEARSTFILKIRFSMLDPCYQGEARPASVDSRGAGDHGICDIKIEDCGKQTIVIYAGNKGRSMSGIRCQRCAGSITYIHSKGFGSDTCYQR